MKCALYGYSPERNRLHAAALAKGWEYRDQRFSNGFSTAKNKELLTSHCHVTHTECAQHDQCQQLQLVEGGYS
jgi:hypothetical protein